MGGRLSTRTNGFLGRTWLLVLLLSSLITSCNRTADQQPGPSSQAQPEERPAVDETRQAEGTPTVDDTGQPEAMPIVDDSGQTDVASDPAQCDMAFGFAHETRNEGVRAIYEGDGALFFTTPYAVNTDGAPTSYHPDDPYGNQGLAINTICNGANVRLPDGQRIDYSNCQALVNAFREARDAGWVDARAPRVEFYGVATKGSSGDERFEPCLISSGPYEGYFVSTTSQVNDPERGRCEQERYLNALELPFIIVPSKNPSSAKKEPGSEILPCCTILMRTCSNMPSWETVALAGGWVKVLFSSRRPYASLRITHKLVGTRITSV